MRKNDETVIAFRLKRSDHAKLKLMAAAERRPINQMSREIMLRAFEAFDAAQRKTAQSGK